MHTFHMYHVLKGFRGLKKKKKRNQDDPQGHLIFFLSVPEYIYKSVPFIDVRGSQTLVLK